MKTLFLVSTRKKRETHLEPLLRSRHELEESSYEIGSIEELEFVISEDFTEIYNRTGTPISDFNLVVFRTIGHNKREAVAIARYCQAKGIRVIDSAIRTAGIVDDENKLAEMLVLAVNGLTVPLTLYCSSGQFTGGLEKISFPAVLKAVDGKKGRSNYLVNSWTDYDTHSHDSAAGMLLQQFIPNDRDYRVLVLNYEEVVVTERRRKDNSTHLNNVSAGGDELLVTDYSGIEAAIELSIRAAKVLDIEVAGVDVVVDKNTGRPYIMEVNRAPELTLEAEFNAYFSMLKDMMQGGSRG